MGSMDAVAMTRGGLGGGLGGCESSLELQTPMASRT
jgi:hypothetical protein